MVEEMMKCIQPLPPLSADTLSILMDIYKKCHRGIVFHRPKYGAKNTNYFIDDAGLFQIVIDKVLTPLNIDLADVENQWNSQDPEYKCSGINFNVLQFGDYLKPHIDYNPTKLNILISGKTDNCVHFVNEDETWDWRSPAILDVSKLHYVTDDIPIIEPRIMMQIFINKEFNVFKEKINLSPTW